MEIENFLQSHFDHSAADRLIKHLQNEFDDVLTSSEQTHGEIKAVVTCLAVTASLLKDQDVAREMLSAIYTLTDEAVSN